MNARLVIPSSFGVIVPYPLPKHKPPHRRTGRKMRLCICPARREDAPFSSPCPSAGWPPEERKTVYFRNTTIAFAVVVTEKVTSSYPFWSISFAVCSIFSAMLSAFGEYSTTTALYIYVAPPILKTLVDPLGLYHTQQAVTRRIQAMQHGVGQAGFLPNQGMQRHPLTFYTKLLCNLIQSTQTPVKKS